MQIYTIAHEPSHFLYRATHILHEPPHSSTKSPPVLSCFCHVPIKRTHRHYAPSPALNHTYPLSEHTYPLTPLHNPSTSVLVRALFYRGGGAVVRWGQSGAPILTNRCFDAVRGNVRRYQGKVYRVSEKSL